MRNLAFIFLLVFLSSVSAQIEPDTISIRVSLSEISVSVSSDNYLMPNFTPGLHHTDYSLDFKETGKNKFSASWSKYSRLGSSGRLGDVFIYNISSGPIIDKTREEVVVRIDFPQSHDLLWRGLAWRDTTAEYRFKDYFFAREFPLILVPRGQYIREKSALNRIDSINVFYVWSRAGLEENLDQATEAVNMAASDVGLLAPAYWHKNIQNYCSSQYTLFYIINDEVISGLEYINSPYSVTVPKFIRPEMVVHTLIHSLVGKSLVPSSYVADDGKYYPSDALGFYEGLTTFLANRHIRQDFPAYFSAQIYRAKLEAQENDLTRLADSPLETYYAKGYLFWLNLQAQGLDVELYVKWLFGIYLSQKDFPIRMDWPDVISWLTAFNPNFGRIAAQSYRGQYLDVFRFLEQFGWQPISVSSISRWHDFYIGPYSVLPKGVQIPSDNHPNISAYPQILILQNGKELPIEAKKENLALSLIKQFPDSLFSVRFSDGMVRKIKDKLLFSDQTPYFMHGTIKVDSQDNNRIAFWRKINFYFP